MRENMGSLSLASSTLTMTCVVAVADGVPLSLTNTVRSYCSRVSRSNVPCKYIHPLLGKMPNNSVMSSMAVNDDDDDDDDSFDAVGDDALRW